MINHLLASIDSYLGSTESVAEIDRQADQIRQARKELQEGLAARRTTLDLSEVAEEAAARADVKWERGDDGPEAASATVRPIDITEALQDFMDEWDGGEMLRGCDEPMPDNYTGAEPACRVKVSRPHVYVERGRVMVTFKECEACPE